MKFGEEIKLERPYVGLLDDNEIKVSWIHEQEIDLYNARIFVEVDALDNIAKIDSDKVVRFILDNKLVWDINIIKRSRSGELNDGVYEVKLLIRVVDYEAD